jgi:hypothetical protein
VLGDQPGEKLLLTEARQLCRNQLAPLSDHALQLDERAYTLAPDVFTEGIPHAERALRLGSCGCREASPYR